MKLNRLPILSSSAGKTFCTAIANPKFVNTAQSGQDNFEKDFEKCHLKTTFLQKVILGLGSGVISITSPSRGDMIAVMGEVTGYQAWEYIQSKMLLSEEGKKILEEKPRISSGAVDLEKLKNYPDGTLGKAYSNFLVKYGYSPDTRNSVQFVDNLELAYVAQRYREAHDLFHTLLDMPTNMLGEVTVKWVEAIQLKLPMCAAGALFGSVRLAPKFTRAYSTRSIVKLFPTLSDQIEKSEVNPKKHPGIMNLPCVRLPDDVSESIDYILEYENRKELRNRADTLSKHLAARHPPVEESTRALVEERFLKELEEKYPESYMYDDLRKKILKRVERRLQLYFYNWKPVLYNRTTALQYLMSRGPAEYAVLKQVFNEIAKRDSEFSPRTVFDFGSGVGSVSWAIKDTWGDTLKEYLCVDPSNEMLQLSAMVLRKNDVQGEPFMKNMFYRKFLPATIRPFDVVVSAFTLFELPNLKTRLKTLTTLWNNTSKYLVLVENGSRAGFDLISEARDYILTISQKHEVSCHIFAPCPHEEKCPRLTAPGKRTPCNFMVKYHHYQGYKRNQIGIQVYSYIVFKKEPAPEHRPCRIVREVLKRDGHVVCRLCTTEGKLEQLFVTASKHGRPAYKCMRYSKWGDIIPGVLEKVQIERRVPRYLARKSKQEEEGVIEEDGKESDSDVEKK